ncbi:hypothetical protein CDD82_6962 [Ophiocordyceps australis]|uniref:Uncharacterized protein n=1 Tax=Ophiocordyceps australis TaxID=1399860 RepID=A0A2C5YSK8_9HYPO|nr:hypothetical protein CDD82_6962 [Ophiocordyceps australis]
MNLMLLFCLVSSATAWVMPENLQDGLYIVHLGGKEPRLHRRMVSDESMANSTTSVQAVDQGQGRDFDSREGRERIRVDQIDAPFRDKSHHDLLPVPVAGYHCDKLGSKLPIWEYAESRQGFKRYCDEYLVPRHTVHLAVSANGSVATFMCNNADIPQVCSAREFQWVERHWLDRRCGFGFPGQVWVQPWQKWYGRAFPGMGLCPRTKWKVRKLRESIWIGHPHSHREKCRKNCDESEVSIENSFEPPKPYYGNMRLWNKLTPSRWGKGKHWRLPWPLWDN